MKNNRSLSGFSLVELSIVLVILGLLVGGILGGQSLIRAAELRSVTTEYDQWRTAINTFRMKYFAIPGDMNNATRFWGDAGVCDAVPLSGGETHSEPLDGTCNGNGNGIVFDTGWDRYERFLFWQHLQLAGLIPGNYSGVRGPTYEGEAVAGVNSPASKLNSAMWYPAYSRAHTDTDNLFEARYTNALFLGNVADVSSWGSLLNPEETWSIDMKLDDGKPATGIVISNRSDDNSAGNCTNGSSPTDYNADYRLDETGSVCSLYFLQSH